MTLKKIINNYKDPLYRNSHYLLINSLASSFLGFIFWIIITKYYNTYDVGLAAALISVSSIISIFSTFGLDITSIRFLSNEKEKNNLINTFLTIVGTISIVLSIIFILGINIWAPSLNFLYNSKYYIILFVIYNVTNGLFLIINSIFTALRDTKFVLFQNVLVNLLRIPLPFFLVFMLSGYSIFASYSLSMAITIIFSLIILSKNVLPGYKPQIHFNKRIISEIMQFSAGSYVSTVFGNLPPLIIPLIILYFLNPEMNAYFYMVITIASVLFVIPVSFSSSLLAEGSFNEKKFILDMKNVFKQIYLILIPLIVITILFGNKLLLLFGENYSNEGSILLSLFAISTVFIGLNTVYVTYLRIKMRIKKIMILTPLNSIIIVISSYILIPKIGILGSGIAYLLGHGLISAYILVTYLNLIINKVKCYKNNKLLSNSK